MKTIHKICVIIIIASFCSCGKEFLDIKANKSQQIPKSIQDYLALMDSSQAEMNVGSNHELGIIGADEYIIADVKYETFPITAGGKKVAFQKNAYTWERTIFEGGENTDWQIGYTRILWTNIAVDGLSKLKPLEDEKQIWNLAMGCALFHRAINYYNLAQLYCVTYNQGTADSDLGLPLRKTPGVTQNVPRSSLQSTYDFIINDLKEALKLLPDIPETNFRPGKPAVYAALARLYLQMGFFDQSETYADRCLNLKSDLLDFNTLDLNLRYTFPVNGSGHSEILFMNTLPNTYITGALFNAEPSLLNSYSDNDLRRKAYYFNNADGRVLFKGSYNGNVLFFSGFATDELWLIRAECRARNGQLPAALEDLNHLLKHRYEKDSFKPIESTDELEVLKTILEERRKELVMRGIRWEDLRRLNTEPRFAKTLVREVNGRRFELPPNDKRYVWPLPPEAVDLGGYQQNNR